jgi:hypothetical protein
MLIGRSRSAKARVGWRPLEVTLPFGRGSRNPSGPAAHPAARKGRTHDRLDPHQKSSPKPLNPRGRPHTPYAGGGKFSGVSLNILYGKSYYPYRTVMTGASMWRTNWRYHGGSLFQVAARNPGSVAAIRSRLFTGNRRRHIQYGFIPSSLRHRMKHSGGSIPLVADAAGRRGASHIRVAR